MHNNSVKIRSQLEQLYDIPFSVEMNQEYGESSYIIAPRSDLKELFEVIISFRQRVRMVIEIKPQRYSANMLHEIFCVKSPHILLFPSFQKNTEVPSTLAPYLPLS